MRNVISIKQLAVVSLITISFNLNLISQNVYIPDPIFKSVLVANTNINTNGDSEIQIIEADNYKGSIICHARTIKDLTGIEMFPNITSLHCGYNQISELDLSSNLALTKIDITFNFVTNLDLSTHSKLTWLKCSRNLLSSLNIANGNNHNLTTLITLHNQDLQCIQVDNEKYSKEHWINGRIDSNDPFQYHQQVSFSEDCTGTSIYSPSDKESTIVVFPNPTNNQIKFSTLTNVKLTDLMGKLIIEKFNTNILDISSLPIGMYNLLIISENGSKFQNNKIMIDK